jgi:hypothetical protein
MEETKYKRDGSCAAAYGLQDIGLKQKISICIDYLKMKRGISGKDSPGNLIPSKISLLSLDSLEAHLLLL